MELFWKEGVTMSSESIFKDILRNFFRSFFRVLAIGCGIVAFFIILNALTSSRTTLPPETTPHMLPTHEWKIAPLSIETPTILKISIEGVIGLKQLNKSSIRKELIESMDTHFKPDQVKAILLYINSPGGVADDADSIYQVLLEYKKRKNIPVYAFIDGLCASGGTYVACAADKIYATTDSLVGHVGVIMPTFFNFTGLMDKLGIQSATIFSGKDKDNMNPFRPWKPGEENVDKKITDFIYDRFTTIVSQHRPLLTKENLMEEGAQIYPAIEAEQLGYIDGRVGSIDEALLLLAKDRGIENNYQFVELKTGGFFADLFDPEVAESFFKRKVEHHVRIAGDIHPELHGKPLLLWLPQAAQTTK